MEISIHKGYLSGCIGRITALHADYYAQQSGFGVYFESRVARELAAFCERYEEARDGLWLALADGRVEGAIAIDGLHAPTEGAHLRWFITSDRLRGSGIGTRLLGSALAFCDERGYARTSLWTFAGLQAARHLYEKQGFRLVHEQPGRQWGNEVMEQRFERLAPRLAE
ncbi:GNAT family N-acetyltransferase [Rhodoferax sp. BAB1]|uniref:GNAT family N-acetyltransferase n=1 Tax=Rhodoferax sp. BAB1 TaxID=2741720 RepID=UPI001575E986|nr:GNAT family N-acetyltransferase [Rhodoferax sp. BAB1]QKO21839.1 GNAT family N-acetyltransferase [Rhodoferax sp. BAB1]